MTWKVNFMVENNIKMIDFKNRKLLSVHSGSPVSVEQQRTDVIRATLPRPEADHFVQPSFLKYCYIIYKQAQ